jgi:hypothetical protein
MHSRARGIIPSHDRQDTGPEKNHEIFDNLTRGRRDCREIVRRTKEGITEVAYDTKPYLSDFKREAEPRQIFGMPDTQVESMAPKQSPRYTPQHAQAYDRASNVWIKARRGSTRTPDRHKGSQVDPRDKIMRDSSPRGQAPRRLQALSMLPQSALPNPAHVSARDEEKAGSNLQFVQAQVLIVAWTSTN